MQKNHTLHAHTLTPKEATYTPDTKLIKSATHIKMNIIYYYYKTEQKEMCTFDFVKCKRLINCATNKTKVKFSVRQLYKKLRKCVQDE